MNLKDICIFFPRELMPKQKMEHYGENPVFDSDSQILYKESYNYDDENILLDISSLNNNYKI